MNSYRFEGQYVKELAGDNEAFEEAIGYYDERSATIEKWIGPKTGWAFAADPLYQPQYFYGKLNGGWVCQDGTLLSYDY